MPNATQGNERKEMTERRQPVETITHEKLYRCRPFVIPAARTRDREREIKRPESEILPPPDIRQATLCTCEMRSQSFYFYFPLSPLFWWWWSRRAVVPLLLTAKVQRSLHTRPGISTTAGGISRSGCVVPLHRLAAWTGCLPLSLSLLLCVQWDPETWPASSLAESHVRPCTGPINSFTIGVQNYSRPYIVGSTLGR